MNLVIFTIVKNGLPFLPIQFTTFNRLKLDWRWIVVEGTSQATHCTAWCKRQKPGLSTDGSTQFLDSIASNPRVTILRSRIWDGKLSMCNAALEQIKEPCALLECDVDEIYSADQIANMVRLFETMPKVDHMRFWCRYYLGENIVSTSTNGYGNRHGEWLRAWRFNPKMRFVRHEPPVLLGADKYGLSRDETRAYGIVFDHFAWAFEHQVKQKEAFYGYTNATQLWRRLQLNKQWPITDLSRWLHWVGPNASADLLFK